MGTEGFKGVLLLTLMIASLMVPAIAITTVSAPSTFSASPGATVSPTSARANTSIKFTVTVTNDYAADNIDNVLLKASGFTQPTDLEPTTWTLSTVTDGARFDAIGDNVITPGGSETFLFLWTTPNITTQKDYMISVLVSKEEATYTSYENLGGFMVTIDGIRGGIPIYNIDDLQAIENDLDNRYYLANDIDALETKNWNGGKGFDPIGDYDNRFTGTFNGNGYVIEDLYINRSSADGVGLFGFVGSGGVVENVGLENVSISGGVGVGGLIGESHGNVSDSYTNIGNVSGGTGVGGLIGYNYGSVSDSYSNAKNVSGDYRVGGLIGYNEAGGVISKSYSAVENVSGNNVVGGLIGQSYGNVSDSYSNAKNVSGDDWVGGLVGYNEGSVSNSYSAVENVSGNSHVGGLVGHSEDVNQVSDSFWDNEICNVDTSDGGTAKTTSEMQSLSTFTDEDTEGLNNAWDFCGTPNDDTGTEDIWNMNDGSSYPHLTREGGWSCEAHDPIYIDGNDNFIHANGVTSGSGTENDPYIIENWDINASGAHGIEIKNTTAYFIIRNTYVHDEWVNYKYGIYFDNVTNGKIDNNVAGNNYFGIYLYFSNNNLISNNLMENNSIGIRLIYSNNNLISNNIVENNNWSGMYLYFSNNNLISNNIVENNADYGIRLDFSGNNLVTNNIVENNDSIGIYLYNSDNNLLSNNLVKNNYSGIPLVSSDNNLIYHNNLISNVIQAYDNGSNYWDNGYPWGGNYWSEYTGADNYRGENHDIPGSDGIGDTPYYIHGGANRDRYPLMNPWSPIRSVKVSISPSYQSGPPGTTLVYTVTVKNTGSIEDNYTLAVADTENWGLALSENRFEDVQPGENRETTLNVTIPENGIGEWLIIGREIDADILDVHRTVFDSAMRTIALLMDTLLTYDWDMNLIPLLAERYEVTPSYIDFYLRKDVKFHSGDPFNAEAVKYTIERAKNLPGSKHVASVEKFEVEIKDDYWVRVHLEEEDRYALNWFAATSSSIVSPRYAEEYGWDYGVTYFDGTGPFKFKEWIRDKRIVLERNPEYTWGPAMYANRGPARIAGVILDVIPEDMVRAAMLEAGDINFMMPPATTDDLARLNANPEIQLFRGPELAMDYIGFHTGGGRHGTYDPATKKWYDENGEELDISARFVGDVRIRQAIAYAIDKEKLIELAVDNIGFPAYGPLTPKHWGYWPGVENYYQYNPERARQLLTEAGYPDGVKIKLLAMDRDRRVAEALYYQLREVGIDLDYEIVPFGSLEEAVRKREHQMYLLGWNWPYEDILFWMFHPDRVPSPNRMWWDHENVESVIDRTFLFDDDEALEALYELQQIIMEDVVWVPWRVREITQFARAEVKGYQLHPWPSWTWKLLDVTVDAVPSTKDNVTVVATSQTDNTVSAENSAIAHAVEPEVENRTVIYPVADVYAFSGYGTGYSRSQLKFDIDNIPSGSNIISAKLWLYRLAADNWDGEILLNRVDDQLWGENLTAIEFDAQTLTTEETRASKFISPGWDYLDLKNQLNVDHEAGHTYSSYRLGWANDNGGEPSVGIDDDRFLLIESELDELSIIFPSSEYNGRDPYLEVVYLRPYVVSVSISPTYKSGTLGEELSYTVMVANTGNLDDNYALTVDDNSGWGTTVSPTSLTIIAGASGTATLTVTIPEDAENGTEDNIIVMATSTENTEVSASASCIAQAVRVGLIPRGPIYINSNDNFIPANGVTSGSGMENDPYIIENWDISAENAHGIEIRNTTARFVIRNCYVHDGDNFNDGIYFDNVTNGKIDNVTSDNNNQGIVLYNSPNNFIENCIISNSSYLGIWLEYSANNILRNNILSNNKYAFGVWSYENIYEFYQDVDNSNSIDGKPIYYVVEQENLIFDGNLMDIGYLGLISSENILVKNLDMSNVFHGILLANTSYSTIENSTFSNTYWGIDLNASSNNVFTSCTVSYSVTGIAPYGSSDNNIIENCTLENNSRDGIRVGPFSSNNIVRNSIIENNLYGIIIYNFANNNLISNNIVKNNYYGIHLEYSSDHNTLTNNTCENNGRNGISLDRGSSNNTIENCTVLNNYGGIALYDSSNNTLSNNIVANNGPWSGIYLGNSDNNLISNNIVENNERGISLDSSSNNNLDNNTCENNSDYGIYLVGSSNNTIENNICSNNSVGIHLWNSSNNTISNNTCENNSPYFGIWLSSSSNNTVENNTCENNSWDGIYLGYYSDNNTTRYNICSNNNRYGIRLDDSSNYNTISNNTCENNSYAIYIHRYISKYSDNNRIYHNNIINNVTQAYDDGSNYWDDGYPSGGNYWSDYTGVDNYRGENQDIPGSDGIGDTPYYIPGDNNQDRYPLMEPWPPEVEKVSWDALITASFSGGSDDAVFGVRPDATSGFDNEYDIPEPPPPAAPPYVRTFFYYPEQTPDELHHSYLAPENLMEWPLRIEYADNIENITLTWSVENVPTEYNVLLYRGEDLITDMRAENNYIFEAVGENHDFRVLVGEFLPFTLELTRGWNMISFPVLPENSSPDSIFGSYYVLYRWDAENKHYVLHADSGSFIEPDPIVEVGVSYWAYVLEDENVALLGVPVNQLTLSLRLGWNLIGPPYRGSSIADPIDDPDNSVLTWAFTWNSREKGYSMTQFLEAGKGYWTYALRECSLTLWAPPVTPPGAPATISASSVGGIGFAGGIPTDSGIENIYIMQHKANSYDNTENLSGHENLQVWEGNTAVIEDIGLPAENIPCENLFDIVVAVKGHTDNMAYVNKENMYVRIVITNAFSADESTLDNNLRRYKFDNDAGTSTWLRANHLFDNDGNGYKLGAGENIDLTVYYYCYK